MGHVLSADAPARHAFPRIAGIGEGQSQLPGARALARRGGAARRRLQPHGRAARAERQSHSGDHGAAGAVHGRLLARDENAHDLHHRLCRPFAQPGAHPGRADGRGELYFFRGQAARGAGAEAAGYALARPVKAPARARASRRSRGGAARAPQAPVRAKRHRPAVPYRGGRVLFRAGPVQDPARQPHGQRPQGARQRRQHLRLAGDAARRLPRARARQRPRHPAGSARAPDGGVLPRGQVALARAGRRGTRPVAVQ